QRADQEPRLQALAAAVLEERRAAAGKAGDVAQMFAGDREFHPGWVVLAQAADPFEQPAAGGIVEILRRQRLLRAGEPGEDILAEIERGELGELRAADEAETA